jgi:hypothetical protein
LRDCDKGQASDRANSVEPDRTWNKEVAMPVENDVHPHHRAPVTVADGSGARPGAAHGQTGQARPKPGNVNAPVKPLPDIKPDPRRVLSRDIDVGLGDIRTGEKEKVNAGKTRIVTGIGHVVMNFTGKNPRATYAEAKPVTDEILVAYSRRPQADVKEVVEGVNNYLQGKVIEDLLTAREMGDGAWLSKALETAKKYVTDAGPNSRTPADRLESMIKVMEDVEAPPFIIDATREACKEAIRSKP